MDIGIVWALSCLVLAISLLLAFIARCNQAQAKDARASWQAAHPTLPKNYDMGIVLMWTGLICAAGAIGGQDLPHFLTSPDVFSGLGVALATWTLIVGTYFVLRRTWLISATP
jgi:hypothetical protein